MTKGRSQSLEARVVTLFISYEGDPPDLAAAGIDPGYDSGGMTTGYLLMRDLDRVESLDGASEVTIQPTLRPLLDTSVKEIKVPWKTPGGGGWPGRGSKVIVAVIDTGIDIFHKSFIRPDGKSRILEVWDQSPGLTGGGPPPSPTMPGRIYNNTQLSDAITAGSFESTDTSGHGTHVAGIAAGAMTWGDRCSQPGTYAGVAPDADLVIAKVIGVQGGDAVAALNWCAQAGSRHGNKAVVVNCSFGHDTGPHDTTDGLDREFDKVLRPTGGPPRGLVVVCAAGNEGAADIHESGTVQPGGSATVPFHMPTGSNQPDNLDIWYDGGTELAVEVIAPPSTTFAPPNTTTQLPPPSTHDASRSAGCGSRSSRRWRRPTTTTAGRSMSRSRPLHRRSRRRPVPRRRRSTCAPGAWQLVLTHISGPAARYDAWFATSHGDGFPRFRKPDDQPGAEPRRRENTVGSPGSCRNVITVANYNDREGTLAASSSRGADNQAAVPAAERKPTIAAPGEAVASARSRLDKSPKNSSCCDQLVVDKDGTSMASPHVAGVVALMLEKHPKLNFEEVRAFLQGSARLNGIPTSELPTEDPVAHIRTSSLWGAGKVDARAATDAVPVPAGGGGGGGGPNPPAPLRLAPEELGYTPHTWASRVGDWRRRFDDHPGVLLLAALVSEHVDEVLWLVNHNRRAVIAWRRRRRSPARAPPAPERRRRPGADPGRGRRPRHARTARAAHRGAPAGREPAAPRRRRAVRRVRPGLAGCHDRRARRRRAPTPGCHVSNAGALEALARTLAEALAPLEHRMQGAAVETLVADLGLDLPPGTMTSGGVPQALQASAGACAPASGSDRGTRQRLGRRCRRATDRRGGDASAADRGRRERVRTARQRPRGRRRAGRGRAGRRAPRAARRASRCRTTWRSGCPGSATPLRSRGSSTTSPSLAHRTAGPSFHVERLTALLKDPSAYLRDMYGFGPPDFDGLELFRRIKDAVDRPDAEAS